ncbi:MAG TPA: class I SAM-dependent methyltransferase [Clostridiales bacterium]|nr:class I SAM-dependent methyltransferase [Clostridiales bacterium]
MLRSKRTSKVKIAEAGAASSSNFLFNTIAPIYGLFYEMQKKRYGAVIDSASGVLDLASYDTVLDVGCGTGALCAVLAEKGLSVTGVDPAAKMIASAKRHPESKEINYIHGSALEKLPFEDNSFDISIASYVAHGMGKAERKSLYAEMARVTRSKVVIYDYNQNRALLTSLIEWLERGDYFRFIRDTTNEMESCMSEMKMCFSDVKVIDVDTRASWYICTPN